MRIMVVSPAQVGRGGGETVLTTVANALSARDHQVCVALEGQSLYPEWQSKLPNLLIGPSNYALSHNRRRNLIALFRWLRYAVRSNDPEVILALDTQSLVLVGVALASMGARGRVHLYSWFHSMASVERFKWALRLPDGHLCVSQGLACEVGRWTAKPTHLIYNPVMPSCSVACSPEVLSQDGQTHLVYVGRLLNSQKRIDLLLRSLAKVKSDLWDLTILGDGPDSRSLRDLARDLGVNEHIRWMGWQRDPWLVIPYPSILVLTSKTETFSMVIVEAHLHGIPVIAMDCDYGPRETIVPGVNGVLIPDGDGNALVNAVESLINGTLTFASPKAIAHTAERFSKNATIDALEAVLAAADSPL